MSRRTPPMKHLNPVTITMSRFLLRNLLKLLSIPQKRQAPTMSRFPATSVRVSLSNSPSVAINTTPTSRRRMPK